MAGATSLSYLNSNYRSSYPVLHCDYTLSYGNKICIDSRVSPIVITHESAAFISTWDTEQSGSSASNQITLPFVSNGSYTVTIDWGDGTIGYVNSPDHTADMTHTYSNSGIYTIEITGNINGFSFNFAWDVNKITNISNWGSLKLWNNGWYFSWASNLQVTAIDILDLSGTTNLSRHV